MQKALRFRNEVYTLCFQEYAVAWIAKMEPFQFWKVLWRFLVEKAFSTFSFGLKRSAEE